MKQERRRPDYENRGFVFHCHPLDELPPSFYETISLMYLFHNQLIEINEDYIEEWKEYARQDPVVKELEESLEKIQAQYEKTNKEFKKEKMSHNKEIIGVLHSMMGELKKERKEIYSKLKVERKGATKDYEQTWPRTNGPKSKNKPSHWSMIQRIEENFSGMNFGDREMVLDGFHQARTNYSKKKGKRPKFKSRFNGKTSLMRRNANGGISLLDLFSKNSNKHLYGITQPDKDGNAKMWWNFGKDKVWFYVKLHREFPEGCYVKNLKLTYTTTSNRFKRESFSLSMTIEEPPKKISTTPTYEQIALYPRWTVHPSKEIEILGVSFDGDMKVHKLFDDFEKYNNIGRSSKYTIFDRVTRMKELQSKADSQVNNAKEAILENYNWLEEKIPDSLPKNLTLVQSGGLRKILSILEKNYPSAEVTVEIDECLYHYDKIMDERNAIQKRLIKHRDHCYWNFAKWVSENAKEVLLQDMDFKGLGMKQDFIPTTFPEEVFSYIRSNKNLASHGDLYTKIKQQCAKRDVSVRMIEVNPVHGSE